MGDRVRLADHVGRGSDREPTLRRLAILAATASLFAFGFTQCGTPTLTCSNPQVLTDYHGTIQYPGNIQVQQDVWSPRNGTKQTMYVCGPASWKAVVNQTGVPSDGVATYPDSQKTDTDWSSSCAPQPALSTFTKIVGTYREVAPKAGSYDFTWDIFLNNYCGKPLTEVMVLNQYRAIDFPASQTVTIDNVPYLWYHSGTLIQFRRVNQNASGTVDLLHVLQWCEQQGLVKPTDTRQFVAYGVEVLTTYGQNLEFWNTGFSVTDS